jgi:hypothetical protein
MSETPEPTAGGTPPSSTPGHTTPGYSTPGHTTPGAAGAGALDYRSPGQNYGLSTTSSPLLRLGGALGIAACVVGLLVLLTACAGMNKVLALSLIPVGLSLPGLIITLVAAVTEKASIAEDTHVLQALFATLVGLIGGLLEMSAWLHWNLFYH